MLKHNDITLKEALLAYINSSEKIKRKLYQTKIKMHWEKTMGKPILKYTTALNLRKKKLYVHISSAALRQELSLGRDKLLKIMNDSLGEEYLEEVIIK